jgi:hypothetical protein
MSVDAMVTDLESGMPESKHRRKGKTRKRPTRNAPPPRNPPPSPQWVGPLGTALLVGGLVVILAGYLVEPLQEWTSSWPMLGSNWPLGIGFVLLIAGFGVLTRWR